MSKLVWDEFSIQPQVGSDRFPVVHDPHSLGTIKRCRLGTVAIAKVTVKSTSHAGVSELTLGDGDDAIVAAVCVEGCISCTQGEAPVQLEPGEGVICDSAEACGLHMAAGASCWALKVLRADIAKAPPHIKRFAGLKLGSTGIAVRLLAKYLDGLQDSDALGDAQEARIFGEHLIDLVGMAIAHESGAVQFAERRGVRAARHAAVLREIERKLAYSTLSAASVAATLGVTPRYVHFLLAESGRTFSEHVLARRLKAAEALLADAGKAALKISTIARQAGFTDMSYFNRSFRLHYGDTPSGFRKRMISGTMGHDDVAA